jgi:endo-1,3(4)-beta-glucanase
MAWSRADKAAWCAVVCATVACSPESASHFDAPTGGAAGAPVTLGGSSSGAGGAAGGGGGAGDLAGGGGNVAVGGSGGMGGGLVVSGANLFGSALTGEHAAFDEAAHSLAPTKLWGGLQKPYPTNAWWENLVLGQGTSPVNVFPYLVAASNAGLRVCQPQRVVEKTFTFSVLSDDLVLSAVESLGARSVVAHDALSVTLEWSQGDASLRTPLVEGMAYVSARYHGLTPRLTSAHAVVSMKTTAGDTPAVDLALNNGQTWRVYSSQAIAWKKTDQGIEAPAAFDGWVRIAVLASPELTPLLDAHSRSVPVGGSVSAAAEGDVAALSFTWKTEGSGEPLMMALPHHLPTLKTKWEQGSVATIRGPMRAVAGAVWQFAEPLTKLSWGAPRPIASERRQAIETALAADAAKLAPTSEEPYFFGKQLGAVARLALIADELGDDALAQQLRGQIEGWLEPWLAGGAGSRLIYDKSWGGLVSRPGIVDSGADFGLGWYNDHHFQYGYFIYAAAVVARSDAAWAEKHRGAIETILRDYASPQADRYFPAYRCKDWFAGHSWAAGIFEFADSRNQESTSEAVNGYYAVYLWGLAMHDDRMRDLGRLMLTTEIRAAQTYWQISDDSIYPEPFADGKIVGVLWATKADHTTWFGSNLEFIHGIQWMPFTPISEELLPKAWISQTYPIVSGAFARRDP